MYSGLNDVCLLVDGFINYKRTLGYKYHSESRVLNTFKKYISDLQTDKTAVLNQELMEKWCGPRPNESRKSQANRTGTLRQLAIYLNDKGYCAYVPNPVYNARNAAFIPYIFTIGEMERIFKTLDGQPHYTWTNSGTLYPVLYRVLYGCGLRINEALSLKIKDVDVETGVITVLHGKNDKQRLVVMSGSLRKICSNYKNHDLAGRNPDDYFFPNKNGNKRSASQVSIYFKEILWKSGIPCHGKGKGPRLHDVRHSFCCHTLKHMVDNGLDMYCALPVLSAYLGHDGIRSTEKYLRLTKAVFPEIMGKAGRHTAEIYPEVYHE